MTDAGGSIDFWHLAPARTASPRARRPPDTSRRRRSRPSPSAPTAESRDGRPGRQASRTTSPRSASPSATSPMNPRSRAPSSPSPIRRARPVDSWTSTARTRDRCARARQVHAHRGAHPDHLRPGREHRVRGEEDRGGPDRHDVRLADLHQRRDRPSDRRSPTPPSRTPRQTATARTRPRPRRRMTAPMPTPSISARPRAPGPTSSRSRTT